MRNRQNAQHSTGPRTPEGKSRAAQNALRHGLSIQRHVILKHEDAAEYHQLLAELREIYEPRSRREELAVEDIAQCRWALSRFDEGEATLLQYHFGHEANPANAPGDYVRYGQSLGYSCIEEPGEPSAPECVSILLLQRYRGHWDRRHQRALAEFDRAQRARRAEAADERKQAEAARKAVRDDARERRQQELHEVRLALARKKPDNESARRPSSNPNSPDAAVLGAIDNYLKSPPPLNDRETLQKLGFVSQYAVRSVDMQPAATRNHDA